MFASCPFTSTPSCWPWLVAYSSTLWTQSATTVIISSVHKPHWLCNNKVLLFIMDFTVMRNIDSSFTPQLQCRYLAADNLSHKSNSAHEMSVSPHLCGETQLWHECHLCTSGWLGNHHIPVTADWNVDLFFTGCYKT